MSKIEGTLGGTMHCTIGEESRTVPMKISNIAQTVALI